MSFVLRHKSNNVEVIMSFGKSLAVGVLVAGGVAGALYINDSGNSRLDALAKNSPDGTVALLAIDGLDEVAELSASALATLDSLPSMFLDLVPSEITQGLLGGVPRVQEILGFDPSEEGALIQTGIDFSKPWGLSVVTSEEHSYTVGSLLQIPTLDEEVALAFVERILNAVGVENSWIELSGDSVLSIEDGGHLAVHGDYLVLLTTDTLGNVTGANELYSAMVSSDQTFAESDSYRNLSRAIGDDWSFVAIVNDEPFSDETLMPWSALGLGGLGFAVTGSEKEIGVTAVVEVDESSSLRRYVNVTDGSDTLGHRLPGEPVALSKFALDLGSLVEMPEVAMMLMLAQNSTNGLDVAGLLNSHDGPIWSAVTDDGVSWNHVALSDTALVEQSLETLCPTASGSMQSLSTGERFCVSELFVAGVLDETLVFGTGQGALQSLQTQGAPGYTSQLSSSQQDVSDSTALYTTVVNLNGVVDTVLAEPNISRELGMAGMLAIGALRSYVPDYLKIEMDIGSHTFKLTVAVENEEGEMPSGATAVAGAGLISAVAMPYLVSGSGILSDIILDSGVGVVDTPVTDIPRDITITTGGKGSNGSNGSNGSTRK